MDVLAWLEKRGYSTVSADFYEQIRTWMEWYKGKVDSFHKYNIYNGASFVGCERYSLGMPKLVCEDWANLLMNERVIIEADGYNTLHDTLYRNNFAVRANQLVEISFAGGTGAFVEYLDAKGSPMIDYVRAEMIFPLSWDNGEITECAFASLRKVGKTEAFYIQQHVMENGTYVIYNDYVDTKTGLSLPLPEGVEAMVNTGSEIPLYQIIKPNIVNNVDFDCPMGISVFANAIDAIKETDLVFDSYCNEFILGRKRIILPLNMVEVEMEGEAVGKAVFDPKDVLFYGIDLGVETKTPVEIDLNIRADEHEKGLQRGLDCVSSKCGLGTTRYKFENGTAKTATEVVSEKSDLWQNLCKHTTILKKALEDMVWALAFLEGVHITEVKVDMDDSVITDEDKEYQRIKEMAAMGYAEGWEVRAKGLKETEEKARASVPASTALME